MRKIYIRCLCLYTVPSHSSMTGSAFEIFRHLSGMEWPIIPLNDWPLTEADPAVLSCTTDFQTQKDGQSFLIVVRNSEISHFLLKMCTRKIQLKLLTVF